MVSCVLIDFHLFWCNITPSLARSLLLSTHDLKWYYALNKWWRVMRLVTYLHDEVCPRDSPVMVPGCKLSSRLFTLLLPTVKEKNRNGFFSVTLKLFQLNFTLGGSNCTSVRVVHLVFFNSNLCYIHLPSFAFYIFWLDTIKFRKLLPCGLLPFIAVNQFLSSSTLQC